MKIRIAHIVGQLGVGGMEKLIVEFARHACRERFELSFVSLGERGIVADEIEQLGWPVETMSAPAGFRPAMIFRMANWLRRQHINIVHTHNTRPVIYGAPAARLAGVDAVMHTRHGQQYGATRAQIRSLRLATRLVDQVACVSEDSARLAEQVGIPRRKLQTIPNGIDLSRFAHVGPQPLGPAVMVARLSPEKDPANLLRAMAIVANAEPNLKLEIAGDGPCRPALQHLAGDLSLHNRVRFCGEVSDVPALLARASMFVLPSLTEGISLTLLEAMARGLPVVATRVGGTAEVVDDGVTGLLVPPASPEALASAMLRVYRDPQTARAMGLAARQRVCDSFDVRRMVARYEALYVDCLTQRRSASRAA